MTMLFVRLLRLLLVTKNVYRTQSICIEYIGHSGTILSRRGLISESEHIFQGDLLVLSGSPGITSIITLRSSTAKPLKIVQDDKNCDDISRAINTISKQMKKKCETITNDKTSILTSSRICVRNSTGIIAVLQDLSSKLDHTLTALLIGNIITSVLTKTATDLQIALGVLLRDSKDLVLHFHDYLVTCTYDEILRFKKSAAVSA